MTEIIYKHFDNEDQLARVKELMEFIRPIFPDDIRHIYVHLYEQIGPNDNSSSLSVDIGNLEYLYFDLYIYYAFFDYPRKKQRAKILHEIIHALQGQLLIFDRDSLIDYVKAQNPDLGAHLYTQHTKLVERFTQQMAFGIDDLISSVEARCEAKIAAIVDRQAKIAAQNGGVSCF